MRLIKKLLFLTPQTNKKKYLKKVILSQDYRRGRYFLYIKIIVGCLILSTTINDAYAQSRSGKKDDAKNESISFKDRWGFKTNAVDWLLTVPNIGVEFDLGNTIRNKRTVSANLKWNWNTSQKYKPSIVFNLFDARVEWRQYFRTRQRGGITKNANLLTRLKETVFTTQRKHPRQNRAYYWGIYANAASYNFKIGKEGKQGTAYGAGVSVGYTAPLYGYRNHYIDLELGGSVGLLYTSYDVYTHDAESNCYPHINGKSKGGHLVPFPVPTDLRVAFVYRFISAGDKYKESIYRRVQIRSEKRNAINAKINEMRLRIDSIASAVRKQGGSSPDSLLNKEELKQWKLMQEERIQQAEKEAAEKLRKHVADSLGIQLSDSLNSEQEKKLRKALKEYEETLKEKAEPQDTAKLAKRAAKEAEKVKRKANKEKKAKKGRKGKKTKQEAEAAATEGEAVKPEDNVAPPAETDTKGKEGAE